MALCKGDLIECFRKGIKQDDLGVGVEFETFLQNKQGKPYDYENGIADFLRAVQERFQGKPIVEDGHIIGVQLPYGGNVSLEPGGQFELSGAVNRTVHDFHQEYENFQCVLEDILKQKGGTHAQYGVHPSWKREEIFWMPKARYKIMRDYMPRVGKHGIDMMLRTCTVQANVDFTSEQDMVRKFRVSLALQPLVTALYGNSSRMEDRDTGYVSFRAYIWQHVDGARTGNLPFVFEETMGFERYVDYLLDVPMYFIRREGRYQDATGGTFKMFLEGKHEKLKVYEGIQADWEDHMTTVFPEVRLKSFLEMRGADVQDKTMIKALPAFWIGLLYDEKNLHFYHDCVMSWTREEQDNLMKNVCKTGLQTFFQGKPLFHFAKGVLDHIQEGLYRRQNRNDTNQDEGIYLAPLYEKLGTFHGFTGL